MTTESVSAQEAVNRLVGAHEITAKRISTLEEQLDKLLKKFTDQNPNPHISSLQTTPNTTSEAESSNANKITKLENQLDEMLKTFQEYREQDTNSTKAEIQTVSERMESIQALTVSYFDEAASKYEESKRQWCRVYADMNNNMTSIMNKLDNITGPNITSPNTDSSTGRPLTATTHISTPRLGPTSQTSPYSIQPEVIQENISQTTFPLNGVKHSIIVPPSSAAPEFHGKHSESPTQFLIRVQEYAESVHAWDRSTLLNGISQFLRDSALEWYCQLRMSHRRPQTWAEFMNLFLAQFNSPVRKAKQEQEWHQCRQKENETINEFLVRLRALWREQKPKENEADLVKHLFCRMRNDLLSMIGTPRNTSLDELIAEVQQIEEILYRRTKNERLLHQVKTSSHQDTEIMSKKPNHYERWQPTSSWSNNERPRHSYTRETKAYQLNEATANRYANNTYQSTINALPSQQDYSEEGYRRGKEGYTAKEYSTPHDAYPRGRFKSYSKNY